MKPQSDSPTASKDSFKLLMPVAANNNFKLASVDIRAAFLQSKRQRRICKAARGHILWKPVYGLDDTLRKFWLRVKEVFMEMDLKIMEGDKAFYFLHEEGKLKGAILTHVDDFNIARYDNFVEMVLDNVERELTISKVEKDKFCFTGLM